MQSLIQTLKNRARRRASQRGAAMVEGAFLSIIFALIFNLCVFSAGMYMAKIESAQVARYHTFYYATHNCEGSVPDYVTPKFKVLGVTKGALEKGESSGQSFPSSQGGGSAPNPPSGGDMKGSGQGGSSADGFIVCETAQSRSTWAWTQPSWYASALSGNADVSSMSCVMCNEPPYGINVLSFLGNLLGQLWGTIKSAF